MVYQTNLEPFVVNRQHLGYKLLEVIVGSNLYGTNTQTSDVDTKIVYIADKTMFLSRTYTEQVNITKDDVAWELSKFLDLLYKNEHIPLDMIHAPADKVLYVHETMQTLFEDKTRFITKKVLNTFWKASYSQIKKAMGTDKKMNWESEKMQRLEPIDFCHVVLDNKRDVPFYKRLFQKQPKQGVTSLKEFLKLHNIQQNNCLLNKLNHCREAYQLFITSKETRGIIADDSNNIRVSETEINSLPFATLLYNGDAYSLHCMRFNQYEKWLKERNLNRFKTNEATGQQIDTKNMLHCVRLIQMVEEIGNGSGYNVQRNEQQRYQLLEIKKGNVDLKQLIGEVQYKEKTLIELFEGSDLPIDLDKNMFETFEIVLRNNFYS
jgi:predicted nucleotidyltransferase